MEILKAATPSLVKKAKKLIADGKVKITVLPEKKTIHIETRLTGKNGVCTAVISDSHTEVTFLEINGRTVTDKAASKSRGTQARYKTLLGRLTVADMPQTAESGVIVSPQAAAEATKNGRHTLLDVREQEEYDYEHVEGSVLFPLSLMQKLVCH